MQGFGKPGFVVGMLSLCIAGFLVSVVDSALAQAKRRTNATETYTRPKPTKPIKPEIPDVDRSRSDKVFLENADSLFRPAGTYEEFQVVKGNVKFRHGGMWMFCDSAYFYPQKNSMDAFGHVEMRQGDTLFVYSDKLYYDGMARHAVLTHGPSRSKVELKNRNVKLLTDSLDYDLNSELGWYSTGGVLEDDMNELTSLYGEYSPATKQSKFRTDVILVNRKDGYRLLGDELDYNTATHIADINTPTRIEGANDTIITTRGWYDTANDHAQLTARSIILHRDSSLNVTTLEGDSIIYDKPTRISRAYMFRDGSKHPAPMVITDTARKVQLVGGYGEYNDLTREAMSTEYPLLMEFSRPDTLFLRADTVRTWIEKVVTSDSVPQEKEFKLARAIGKARFFGADIQGIADTLFLREQDSMLYMLKKPMAWTGERQIYGNRINVHFNDSVPDWAELPEWGLAAEHVAEEFYNQLMGARMMAHFENKQLKRLDVDGNVVAIVLPQESDSSYNKLVHAESSFLILEMDSNKVDHMRMWPKVNGTVTPIYMVKSPEQYLEDFRWYEIIRPERNWYGDKVRWIDYLGEVPEELETYFNEPPLFKPVVRPVRPTGPEFGTAIDPVEEPEEEVAVPDDMAGTTLIQEEEVTTVQEAEGEEVSQ
ncbi:MAG: hypothetical protein K2M87_00705 [Muribaculaceae bacterium]|nr:hypothetical protein [Muribaculaceae bacterium]